MTVGIIDEVVFTLFFEIRPRWTYKAIFMSDTTLIGSELLSLGGIGATRHAPVGDFCSPGSTSRDSIVSIWYSYTTVRSVLKENSDRVSIGLRNGNIQS